MAIQRAETCRLLAPRVGWVQGKPIEHILAKEWVLLRKQLALPHSPQPQNEQEKTVFHINSYAWRRTYQKTKIGDSLA
jgi:hypothetical protein